MSETDLTIHEEDARTPLIEGTDPFALFEAWFAAAREAEPGYPNAMTLATVDAAGRPDARIVLLKDVDAQGFVFYTNTLSVKGRQLDAHPHAALCFYWGLTQRQVRVLGPVHPVSAEEADAYFATRPRGSQIGAWASSQSEPLADRTQFLARVEEVERRYEGGAVPRPPHWSGYRVAVRRIEFWQERPFRLHDRLVFERTDEAVPWHIFRIYP